MNLYFNTQPGAGKSTMLNAVLDKIPKTIDSSWLSPDYICASATGSAALLLRDGRTLHSVGDVI
jgi:hypothetical protein